MLSTWQCLTGQAPEGEQWLRLCVQCTAQSPWTKRPMLGRMWLGPESLRQASWRKCGESQGLSGSKCKSEMFQCPRGQMRKRTSEEFCIKLTVFSIKDYFYLEIMSFLPCPNQSILSRKWLWVEDGFCTVNTFTNKRKIW